MLDTIFQSFGATYITSVIWLLLVAFVSSMMSIGFISFYFAVLGLISIWYKYSMTVADDDADISNESFQMNTYDNEL